MKKRNRESNQRDLLVTHFPPCSESLDELVLEPEPDELESSSSESSELELLLALSREDLDSRLELGNPLEAGWGKKKGRRVIILSSHV